MKKIPHSYMKLVLSAILFIVFAGCGCNEKAKRTLSIKKLYPGLSIIDFYKVKNNNDSTEEPVPPPPDFKHELVNNNIIEAKDGRVYFYSFERKVLCGYVLENEKEYTLKLYDAGLDTLRAGSLKLIGTNNISDLILQTTDTVNRERLIPVSVGIQGENSENKVLITILETLSQHSAKYIWKIRRINNKEDSLLSKLYTVK